MEVFKVIKPGLLTTVQDLGRWGYQQYGVPVAGAMDSFALRAANLLVGNDQTAACLEMAFLGPTLTVLADTAIAVTGADFAVQRNGRPLPLWRTVLVQAGDTLVFGGARHGCYGYLAVAGGIDVPVVMGSRATYLRGRLGGLAGRALQTGDVIHSLPAAATREEKIFAPEYIPAYSTPIVVRAVPGPQEDYFTPAAVETFFTALYRVTKQADRMGYRLEGPQLAHRERADIISDGVSLGAVQVPGHGMPIVMMADRQTTGGYPKIATVISCDIGRLAQARPGAAVRFQRVTVTQAQELVREEEKIWVDKGLVILPARERGRQAVDEEIMTEILKLAQRQDIEELHYETKTLRFHLRRQAVLPAASAQAETVVAEPTGQTAPEAAVVEVTSPMVGVFYRSPAPDAKPYVEKGDVVTAGQTLCLIEVMKVMHEVKAEHAGTVAEICVPNGAPVEYGQTLFVLRCS